MAEEKWPPNQDLNQGSNVAFNSIITEGYHYASDPLLDVIPPATAPTVVNHMITADILSPFDPVWAFPENVPGQSLYPASSPTFNSVEVNGTMTANTGHVAAEDNLYVGDTALGGTGYSMPAPITYTGYNHLVEQGPDAAGQHAFFSGGMGALTFNTDYTTPFVADFIQSYWDGVGAGFIPGAWHRFTLVPTTSFPPVSNAGSIGEWERWAAIPSTQPQYTLLASGGLFQVDWSFSAAFSAEFWGLQEWFEFTVATNTGAAPIIDTTGPSFSLTNKGGLLSTGHTGSVGPYQTTTGRGFIQVETGQHLGFYGRLATAGPGGGGLLVKNLSVVVKRLTTV